MKYILYESHIDETRIMKNLRFNTKIIGLYDEKKLAINELQKYVDDIVLNLTDEHNWYIKEFDIKLAKEENKNIVAVYEVFNEEIDNCGEVFYVILEQIGVEVI